jgi:hypothetical protein
MQSFYFFLSFPLVSATIKHPIVASDHFPFKFPFSVLSIIDRGGKSSNCANFEGKTIGSDPSEVKPKRFGWTGNPYFFCILAVASGPYGSASNFFLCSQKSENL